MTAYAHFRRNLSLLSICWAIVSITNMLNVSASALVGHMLAENKAFATFPIALQWIGLSACTIPASFIMSKIGRKGGFIVAGLVVCVGAGFAILGIYERSFHIYCTGSVFLGAGQGFAWYYRFAAAEAAPPNWKARSISLVLAGGVISALFGPTLADFSKDMLAPVVFAGSFVTIIVLQAVVIVILQFVKIPRPPRMRFRGGRPLTVIARQPKFVVAATAGIVAYAGMVMLMSVTPLAMQLCGLSFYQTTSVIQWHVLGMFVPAFFTGSLVHRFGTYKIMLVGGIAMACCILIGTSGQSYTHFWAAQTLLGIGWNFLYVGATTLLTETYSVEERAKTQALNEFLVFIVTATAIFLSGQLLHSLGETGDPGAGWSAVNLGALPLVLLTIGATVWIWLKSRKPAPVPAEAGAE
ncbi:MAG: MFS transporter [Rhodospirillaceae bacterium]|nr:MFS transporter [Rhodospirillaceae bacterium]